MIRTAAVAVALLASLASPAAAREPLPLTKAQAAACGDMRRVGIILGSGSARVVGYPTPTGPQTFVCLAPGHRLSQLRVRFVLHAQHEDEPARVEILGTRNEPVGCHTDAECEALDFAPRPTQPLEVFKQACRVGAIACRRT